VREEHQRYLLMSIEQEVIEKLRTLPADKQSEVLAFVESLQRQMSADPPPRSLRGLWADLDISITDEDIAAARREMWAGFPRDIP
jgi:hypothetical protein